MDVKRTPLKRKTRLVSSGRIKPNAKRAKATKDAASGPIARRKFVASLPCAACHVVGYSQGAHVLGNGGTGKKKGPKTIAPLCGPRPLLSGLYVGCHRFFDERRAEFYIQWPTFDPESAAAACDAAWQEYINEQGARS